jgi:hypothetical protein
MSGLEFHGAAPPGSELLAYETGHDMRLPEIRADRRAFLTRVLDMGTGRLADLTPLSASEGS